MMNFMNKLLANTLKLSLASAIIISFASTASAGFITNSQIQAERHGKKQIQKEFKAADLKKVQERIKKQKNLHKDSKKVDIKISGVYEFGYSKTKTMN